MGIGAYTSAVMTVKAGSPYLFSILAGGILASIVGILVAIPLFRLKGFFFAIATLGFGECLVIVFYNCEFLGGALGFRGIPIKTTPYLILIFIGSVIYFFVQFSNSRLYRAFTAVKNDEEVAAAMGLNINRIKISSLGIGAAICGIAGGLYAHLIGVIEPPEFGFTGSLNIFLFSVIGGTELFVGSIFGAGLLTIFPEVFRFVSKERMIIYGVFLILIMIFRPQGLIDRSLIRKAFSCIRR